MSKNKPGVAILVIGAPRSGTSAVSNVLSELGVDFGDRERFVDPEIHRHNPIFFELQSLNHLNDAILAELGFKYADFDYFPDLAQPDANELRPLVLRAQRLIEEEFSRRLLIGMKDPRFTFTLPVWEAALGEMNYRVKYILMDRAVADVIDSNEHVNRYGIGHNRRIARISFELAAARLEGKEHLIVSYDRLIESPADEAHRIGSWLGVADVGSSADAAEVIHKSLRHQHTPRSVQTPNDRTNESIEEGADRYRSFRALLEQNGILDLISSRRDQVRALEARAAFAESRMQADSALQSEIASLAGKIEVQTEALALLTGNLSRQDQLQQALVAKSVAHDELVHQRDDLQQALVGRSTAHDELAHQRDDLQQALAAKSTAHDELLRQQDDLQQALMAKSTAYDELLRQQDNLQKALMAKSTAHEELVHQRDELQQALAAKSTAHDELLRQQDNLQQALMAKSTAHEELAQQRDDLQQTLERKSAANDALLRQYDDLLQEQNLVAASVAQLNNVLAAQQDKAKQSAAMIIQLQYDVADREARLATVEVLCRSRRWLLKRAWQASLHRTHKPDSDF
ncbi:sulfotransferase [Rhodanobacter sp. FW102-FHT14D06]|uniref:Sulfotransferase n=2 Tax=unclassified Rhodanobacter TaxID=2621553 RepID=A0AB74URU8_9GAMM